MCALVCKCRQQWKLLMLDVFFLFCRSAHSTISALHRECVVYNNNNIYIGFRNTYPCLCQTRTVQIDQWRAKNELAAALAIRRRCSHEWHAKTSSKWKSSKRRRNRIIIPFHCIVQHTHIQAMSLGPRCLPSHGTITKIYTQTISTHGACETCACAYVCCQTTIAAYARNIHRHHTQTSKRTRAIKVFNDVVPNNKHHAAVRSPIDLFC